MKKLIKKSANSKTHKFIKIFFGLFFVSWVNFAWSFDLIEFKNSAEKQKFFELAQELRCMQCDNQSILDSHSFVAKDMRMALIQQIRADKNQQEIKQFFQTRFGDAVLYDPPLNKKTWFLWAFTPVIFTVFLGIFLWRLLARKTR